ncbi:MAG: AcrR family transcriptional regulator [Pontimonas sp.]|jgi:AcrR family transcriptional regulator
MSLRENILSTALARYALHGIAATSVQDIADHAQSSKANVLYHFTSKEQLVDSALSPAVAALDAIVLSAETTGFDTHAPREEFVEGFVDFLLHHRLAVQIIVTHPYMADSIPALRSAHELMGRMESLLAGSVPGHAELSRFGIAISGATYALVSSGLLGRDPLANSELRSFLREALMSTLDLEPSVTAAL